MNVQIPRRRPESDAEVDEMAAVEEGLAELDGGQRIPLEDVKAWVASWGTADELPMPAGTTASGRK